MLPPLKKSKLEMSLRICTHSGPFHADESLAVFMLRLLPKFQGSSLMRSRDPAKWTEADIVVDVGAQYDGVKFFDHHQKGFEETFNDSYQTKLSSAGLVYKHYGKEVIAQIIKDDSESVLALLHDKIYQEFIEAIDANDNGISKYEETSEQKFKDTNFKLSSLVSNLNPLWNESSTDADYDRQFEIASQLMGSAFTNVVRSFGLGWLPAKDIVEKAFESRFDIHESGKIVLIEQFAPWKDHLFNIEDAAGASGQVLFVLFPDSSNKWRISTVPLQGAGFQNRRTLPEEWRGLRDETLSEKAGIPGCIFVHAAGFIGGAETREAVVELAKLSI